MKGVTVNMGQHWDLTGQISFGNLLGLYQVDGEEGVFEAKIGQSYSPQRMNSLVFREGGSERANDPAFGEAEGDDDEDKVEDHHDPAHRLSHLPLEDDDGDEDKEEHDEEHPNGATDANAVHL